MIYDIFRGVAVGVLFFWVAIWIYQLYLSRFLSRNDTNTLSKFNAASKAWRSLPYLFRREYTETASKASLGVLDAFRFTVILFYVILGLSFVLFVVGIMQILLSR